MRMNRLPASETALPLRKAGARLTHLARVATGRSEGLVRVMARREFLRFLGGGRSHQGLLLGLFAAAGCCLLIPLHRWYGAGGGTPHFLLYAVLVQVALFLLTARAVWTSMRLDAATGSLDELLLTGAGVPELLLGKCLGVAAAGSFWSLMLLPFLLLAGALTGPPPGAVPAILVSWALTAVAGGVVGTIISLSERGGLSTGAPIYLFLQFWFASRWVLPRLGVVLGPVGRAVISWMVLGDPFMLVPAALGNVREPWLLKAVVLAGAIVASLIWLAEAEHDLLPSKAARVQKDPSDLFSLRPVRAWVASAKADAVSDYHVGVMLAFERAHGWRLRVSPVTWGCILGLTVLPAIPACILGRDGHVGIVVLTVLEACFAATVGALGMAAALASEREQGRWEFLLCSPVTVREILWAKWRTVTAETWPLWAAAGVRGLAAAACGALPLPAVALAALAAPVAAGTSAAVVAALCARAPSLTSAQQRAVLWLAVPTLTAFAGWWLLPRATGAQYVGFPLMLGFGLQFGQGWEGTGANMAALLAYCLLGVAAFFAAEWQLRAFPPLA